MRIYGNLTTPSIAQGRTQQPASPSFGEENYTILPAPGVKGKPSIVFEARNKEGNWVMRAFTFAKECLAEIVAKIAGNPNIRKPRA